MESSATKTPKSQLSLPLRTRIVLSIIDLAIDPLLRDDSTVPRRLLNLVDFKSSPLSIPINGVKTHDVVVDPTRNLSFRVFVPTQYAEEDLPVMVYFHGGGYIFLSPYVARFDYVGRKFASELHAIVVSVDYRLAPENRHPSQQDDGFDVLKFLDNEVNRSKWLPENSNISRCFIAGESAGGHLAHHLTLRASQFKFQQLKVIGLVAIQPFLGGEERTDSEIRMDGSVPLVTMKRTDWFWNAFMPQGEPYNRDHPIINVTGPNAVDISKMDFPATMVVAAGFDTLRDRHIRYYQWLKKSGKEAYLIDYPNMFHEFFIFNELPESDQLMLDVKDFIKTVLNKVLTEFS